MTTRTFQSHILSWYKHNKRDLPWRHTTDPYEILVSEIMLQQTQVSRVIPKYELFLRTFPTIHELAHAPDGKLLEVWNGLGYWRRAQFLKKAAQNVTQLPDGFPKTPQELQQLPGVGPYTAGAVACFAFGSTDAFIDTNIRKIYLHFFFPNQTDISDSQILDIAQRAVYKEDPRNWHWALFDYGATELRDKTVNKRSKHYAKQSPLKGSFRFYRALAVKKLLEKQRLPKEVMLDFLEETLREDEQDHCPQAILDALVKDNLIKVSKTYYHI